eukprot:scaffold11465_cov148-Skeletonema_dohrnii-CCMP3373.AAC.2
MKSKSNDKDVRMRRIIIIIIPFVVIVHRRAITPIHVLIHLSALSKGSELVIGVGVNHIGVSHIGSGTRVLGFAVTPTDETH